MPDATMPPPAIEVRLLEARDTDDIVRIDAELSGRNRRELLRRRLDRALAPGRVATSLVAVVDRSVVGYVLSDVVVGAYGAVEASATLDTIGVTRAYQHHGVAKRLLRAFVNNMRALRVEKINTQVNVAEWPLLRFFTRVGFQQAQAVPLELDVMGARTTQWLDAEAEEDHLHP